MIQLSNVPSVNALLALAAVPLLAGGCCFFRGVRQGEVAGPSVSGRWEIGPDKGRCAIEFSFAPPHEGYAGVVRSAIGWVEVDGQGRMSGQFAVRAQDVDMGEDELTQNVRYAAEMLQGEDFPEISFTFRMLLSKRPSCRGAQAVRRWTAHSG